MPHIRSRIAAEFFGFRSTSIRPQPGRRKRRGPVWFEVRTRRPNQGGSRDRTRLRYGRHRNHRRRRCGRRKGRAKSFYGTWALASRSPQLDADHDSQRDVQEFRNRGGRPGAGRPSSQQSCSCGRRRAVLGNPRVHYRPGQPGRYQTDLYGKTPNAWDRTTAFWTWKPPRSSGRRSSSSPSPCLKVHRSK